MYGCGKGCLIPVPFRLPQISCFTLSLKCFSSDSDNCPGVGIGRLLQFPYPQRAGLVLLTLLFFPLVPSYCGVLRGSIYSFPLVRYRCPLSAGVLHALLCLKMYSWCIRRERYTPCPPTPLTSFSSAINDALIDDDDDDPFNLPYKLIYIFINLHIYFLILILYLIID